ncbi:MAG: NAD(P)-dependent alcohol dehydrogenase [Saccharofermentanales bacterium]
MADFQKMKAVVYDKSASPDVLVYREVEKPIPSDDEVLVRIHVLSLNAADYRSMKMGAIPKRKIFGADIAGRIEEVGKNESRFEVGDEVLGDISGCGFGGLAEYVAVPASTLVLKPPTISFETAAAVPMSAVTALQGLRSQGNIREGQRILIYGAGGGVGTFAVQLARNFGAEVTAVCGKKTREVVQSLGADQVLDYRKDDLMKSNRRYDLILAINGSQPLSRYKRLLAAGGICIVVGGALSQVLKVMLFGPAMSIGSRKMRILRAKPDATDLSFIIGLVEDGKLIPVIDRIYPLAETADAMRYLSGGHALGKVVIKVIV